MTVKTNTCAILVAVLCIFAIVCFSFYLKIHFNAVGRAGDGGRGGAGGGGGRGGNL